MVDMDLIAAEIEESQDFECIGFFDGLPYFIDVSGCPFFFNNVMVYNPSSELIYDIEPLSSIKDPHIKEVARAAMIRRNTTMPDYIELFKDEKNAALDETRTA